MKRALNLSAVGGFAAEAFGVIGAVYGDYITIFIGFVRSILNVICTL